MAKYFDRSDRKRQPRALTRCGCRARLDVQMRENGGIWFVKDFVDAHDHPLAIRDHAFVLRSHRGLNDAQKAEAVTLGLGGLRPCQIMDVMERFHGGPGETGFLLQDLYNFFSRMKKERIQGNDADYVLNYMRAREEEDAEFFFKYSTDEEGWLQNLFWSDSQSQVDYDQFSDVIIFDSTYRVNRYNLPFVPFVGVDQHRSTVLFGCGIISDETVASYIWLLEAFLEAMHQRHPESLIIDGDAAMARAIEFVMPEADHRLCSWHIEHNMIKRLRGLVLKEFRKLIYHTVGVDEFERCWAVFNRKYTFKEENKLWLMRLYELRHKWSAAYTKGRRFLGMQSNQRSESLNSRLHNHLDRKMSLIDLVVHYQSCLSSIRRDQLELDAKALTSVPFTDITADVFEKMAACTFTPTMFPKVREQVRRLSKWEVTEVTLNNGCMRYEVSSKGNVEAPVHVTCSFNGLSMVNASCQCRLMESESIPCGHLFCVIRYMQVKTIPTCYVSHRWTMQGRIAFPYERGNNAEVWSEQMDRFHDLRKKANLALFRASRSVDVTERLLKVFDDVTHEDIENHDSTEDTSFGSLPAYFSGVYQPSTSKVLDPKKIVSRGARLLKKRWRPHTEAWKTNWQSKEIHYIGQL